MNIFKRSKAKPINKVEQDFNKTPIKEPESLLWSDTISPSSISTAIYQEDNENKLQPVNILYDELLKKDANLAADVDTRTEALKTLEPVIKTEISDKQEEYFNGIIKTMYPMMTEVLVESKLKRFAFYQIIWEMKGNLWYPVDILDYKKLDLRIVNRNLELYQNDKKRTTDQYRFIKILRKKSILRSLLKYYVFKSFALNNWASFTEIYGKGARVGKYKNGTTSAEKDELWTMLKDAGNNLAMMISENVEIEWIDHMQKSATSDLYRSLCEFCESKTTKRILGQTVVTEQEKHGSEAKAKIANLVRQDILAGDARDMEIMLSHLFTMFNKINFNENTIEVDVNTQILDPSSELEMDIKLVRQIGLQLDEDYFYEKYNRPRPEGTVINPPSQGGIDPGNFNNVTLKRSKGDVQNINKFYQRAYIDISAELERVTDQSRALLDELQGKKSYDSIKKTSFPTALYLTFGEGLLSLIKTSYISGNQTYMTNLKGRLPNSLGRLPHFRNDFTIDWSTPDLEALHAFRAEAFEVTKVTNDQLLQSIKDQAEKAISEGITFNEFKKNIKLQGFEPDNPYHVRTNFNTGVNNAYHASQWQDIQKTKDLLPYLQYQAIIDDFTRDEHAVLHGIIKPVDDPFWDEYFPPNGWNCRCDHYQMTADEALGDPKYGVEPDLNLANVDPMWLKNTGKDLSIWGKWLKGKDLTSMTAESLGLSSWRQFPEHDNMPFIYTADMSRDELISLMADHLGDRIITDHAGFPVALPRAKADKFKSSKYTTKDIETRVRYLNHLDDTLTAPDEVWGVFAERRIRYIKKYEKDVLVMCEIEKGEITYFNIMVNSDPKYIEKIRIGTLMK